YNPENTIKAFKSAIEMGADGIELDVQKTKDNILIVCHDENLKRLTGIDLNIRRTEFEKIKNITIQGEPLVDLEKALEFIKSYNKFVDIEVKNPQDFLDVIKLVKKINLKDFIISSFWHKELFYAKKSYPEIRFAYLYVHFPKDISIYAKEIDFLKPHFHYINEEYVPYKDKTIAWTVDEEENIDYLLKMDIFGIISNFPDKVIKRMKGGKIMYQNPYLSYFIQMIDKKSIVRGENYISFEATNYVIPLRIESISMEDGEINLNKSFPLDWNLGERLKFEITIKGENPKIKIRVREVGELSFSLKELEEVI
ncbi:MAG: glycerophosphodiester phosphodiesterase family protein, partial [Dictyoglomaceae bacterium]|nr:glycerophosphodiester phosphodiesterase family protein [Dictyoglomaceae bacterium]